MKHNIIREWLSIFVARKPRSAILMAILVFNLVFLGIAAITIAELSAHTLEVGFWESFFYTISMILDAGCIQYVVEDIGTTGTGLVVVCLITVFIGMITFTGAVIGYVTNYISNFIDHSNSGKRRLNISEHTVILNWNSRASEIVNDLLYEQRKEKILVLSNQDSEEVKRDIEERILDTLMKEKKALKKQAEGMSSLRAFIYKRRNVIKNKLVVIVRQGDTYSAKQLADISLSKAKTVVILSDDIHNESCKYDLAEKLSKHEKGDSNIIKTLIQVAEITSAQDSADKQKIIVEAENDWTLNQVNKIIKHKEKLGKCNIIPISVNKILGQILSQFSIMPELNLVYSDLFSNKGAEFFCREEKEEVEEREMIRDYLKNHLQAIPATVMDTKTGRYSFFVAEDDQFVHKTAIPKRSSYKVDVNKDYWFEHKNVVILGHNSNSQAIMNGFNAFRSEWNFADGSEILNIIVIDDKKSLDKHNRYADYPYVRQVIEADIYDRDIICDTINRFIDSNEGDTSVLILSDDMAVAEEMDANALTYLIYVQDIVYERQRADSCFDVESIDVVVEILNPKNYDVVHNYSVNNVVISNRYISKMITQIGEKEALYELYNDILTYDEGAEGGYDSKELYVKKVSRFFNTIPGPCTAAELIRSVYEEVDRVSEGALEAIVIGYVSPGGKIKLFIGNQESIRVELTDKDKLILFSNH